MALIGLALIAFLIPIQPPTGTPSHPTGGGLEVVDVAAEAGIDETTTSWGLATSDFDDDGLPDLFLGRHLEAARLYRNVGGGRFLEVEPGTFPARDRHDCAWADVDLDDLVDLYCSIGAEHGTATKANELWMQQPDHSFVDRATELGVADPYGRGRRVTFIDANGDAYPDLFVGNLYPRQDDVPSPNRLFINRGGRFREAPRFGLTEEVGAGCAQAADFDDDGWEDLLVCGLDSLHLYRNRDGEGFHDVSGSVGVSGKSRSALLVDLGGDERLDLIQVVGHTLSVRFQRRGGFGVVDATRPLRAGARIAVGDVDRDDRPDVYLVVGCGASGRNLPDVMLLNRGGASFRRRPLPQTGDGCGDVALAIDHDGNGTTDFVVMNGRGYIEGDPVSGPVQLISFPS